MVSEQAAALSLVTVVSSRAVAGTAVICLISFYLHFHTRRNGRLRSVLFYMTLVTCAVAACRSCAKSLAVGEAELLFRLWNFVVGCGSRRHCLLLFWLLCVAACQIFISASSFQRRSATTIQRKFFHLVVSLVCLSGLRFDALLLNVGSILTVCAYLICECCRSLDIPPAGRLVNSSFALFVDSQDSNTLVLTPLYLLLGTFFPIWLESCGRFDSVRLIHLAGVLSLGVADSAAAMFGSLFGRRRWSPNTNKTIVGSVACFSTHLLATMLSLLVFCSRLPASWSVIWISVYLGLVSLLVAIAEASVANFDNVLLPVLNYLLFLPL